jgi:hypothetical protein
VLKKRIFRVGFNEEFPSRIFNGFLDDIVFYDRPLTAKEVNALFSSGSIRQQCGEFMLL